MSNVDYAGAIGAIAELIKLIAKAMGETTDEISARVQAECEKTASNPTDETDAVAGEIDSHLPNSER